MKRGLIFLSLITLLGIGFISFKLTYSFFSDSGNSTSNIFSAAEQFPSPIPSPGDIVINELYFDVCTPAVDCGNNPQNEWVEIYNNSSFPIVLTGWTLTDDNGTDILTDG